MLQEINETSSRVNGISVCWLAYNVSLGERQFRQVTKDPTNVWRPRV